MIFFEYCDRASAMITPYDLAICGSSRVECRHLLIVSREKFHDTAIFMEELNNGNSRVAPLS